VVAWQDDRGGELDIWALRLTASGAPAPGWPAGGVPVCLAGGLQANPQVVSDMAGGAIVTWMDERGGADRVYAQRVAAAGAIAPGWPADGIAVATGFGDQREPMLVSDGAGGALIAWAGSNNHINYHPFVQSIRASGATGAGWPAQGVRLCSLFQTQTSPRIVTDGAGGAIVVWSEWRDFTNPTINYDLYAQRVDLTGAVRWTSNGVPVCTAERVQESHAAVSDQNGGVIVAWQDRRLPPPTDEADIYALRITRDGFRGVGWVADGTPLCTVGTEQRSPVLVADGYAGAIVAWTDARAGAAGSGWDVFAQRTPDDPVVPVLVALVSVDATRERGRIAWRREQGAGESAAVERRVADGPWSEIATLLPDARGGYVVEDRDVVAGARYTYRLALGLDGIVSRSGEVTVGIPGALALALDPPWPNPAAAAFTIAFTVPTDGAATLELLDLSGRRIELRAVGTLGAGRHTLRLGESAPLAPGLYFVRLTAAGRNVTARVCVAR
jgi:hypothetical protein